MKKQLLPALIAVFCIPFCQNIFATDGPIHNRGCGAMEYRQMEEQRDPSIKAKRAQIEKDIQAYIQNQMLRQTPTPHAVITMPIVFHIVYKTAAENLSDACIAATIKAFNEDFRKQNADFTTKCPSAFQSLGADCEIQFCLASKDPSGAATNGIIRTSTTHAPFGLENDIKYTSQGGSDIWDHTKYVNMWIGNLEGGLLGYGTFPGGPADADGVVCHYQYMMGSAGCGDPPFQLGRTTVHELGHFFNLAHIWGDSNCGDDGVSDTPTQQTSNFNCPSFPNVSCNNGPNGDLFCNYMDYVDDPCMVMFTAGQKTRILAAINSSRAGLKTSAASLCAAAGGLNEIALDQNVYIYPNPSTGDFIINVENAGVSSAYISVYNELGEAIIQKRIIVPSSNEIKVDLNNKPDGIYLIKMKTSEGTVTKKVLLNR